MQRVHSGPCSHPRPYAGTRGMVRSGFQPTGCLAQPGPAAVSRLKTPDCSEKAAGCLEVGAAAVQALPWSLHHCPRSNGTWPAPWWEVSLALWPLGAGGTAGAFPQEAGAQGSTHVSQLAESPHGRKAPVPPSPSCCSAAQGRGPLREPMKTRLSQQQRDHESAEGRPCQSREVGALAAPAPPAVPQLQNTGQVSRRQRRTMRR